MIVKRSLSDSDSHDGLYCMDGSRIARAMGEVSRMRRSLGGASMVLSKKDANTILNMEDGLKEILGKLLEQFRRAEGL